jgi:cysteine synthase A
LIQISEKIYAKFEAYNPSGSVKDRMVSYIINKAIKCGEINPETVFIEATSGNTGISLSMLGASMSREVIIIMPKNMSAERKKMMKAFGADLIEVGDNAFKDAINLRDEMLKNNTKFWSPKQFSNIDNIECHENTTGPEILRQIPKDKEFSAFVHGAGTGGTMMGVINHIKKTQKQRISPLEKSEKKMLDPKFVLVIPNESAEKHGIQGINDGEDFLLNRSKIDAVLKIKTLDAINRSKKLANDLGLFVGISSGANVLAAETWVKNNNPGGVVITMLCDRGERYLSLF